LLLLLLLLLLLAAAAAMLACFCANGRDCSGLQKPS